MGVVILFAALGAGAGHVVSKPVVRQCILTAFRDLTDANVHADSHLDANVNADREGADCNGAHCGESMAEERRLPSAAVHEAVLLTFNELNRRSPGTFFDPPSRREVKERCRAFACSHPGSYTQAEFEQLMLLFLPRADKNITRDLVLACTAVPCIAVATKRVADEILRRGGSKRSFPVALLACVVGVLWRCIRH